MSALTTIFNHLYVYLYCLIKIIFGGECLLRDFANPEQKLILQSMGESLYNFYPDYVEFTETGIMKIVFETQPILILIVGVFTVGSIIGLTRRLFR